MEIIETIMKDRGSLRVDPKGVRDNALNPTLSLSSPPKEVGPKGPLVISGDNLPLS